MIREATLFACAAPRFRLENGTFFPPQRFRD